MQALETVQDFFWKLVMKSRIHLEKLSIFFTIPGHCQTYHNYEQAWQKSQKSFLQSNSKVLKIGQIFFSIKII